VYRDGYQQMFEPADEEYEDRLDVARQFLANPARNWITDYLVYAEELGFDRGDPDIVHRATVAGERAHAAYVYANVGRSFTDPRRHEPIVYYMKMGDLVKIGTSINIAGRMDALHPERLLAVEMGGYQIEGERHRQFAADRNHGEWFRVTDQLVAHMSRARMEFEALIGLTLDEWLAERLLPTRQLTSSASIPTPSPVGPEPAESSPSDGSASVGQP